VKRLVLDTSVVLKWFTVDGERNVEAARALRAEFQAGTLVVIAPRLLLDEILAAVASTTRWPAEKLVRLATELERVGFEVRDPPASAVAEWVAAGLSPSEAAFAAVASTLDVPLVTDDERLARSASSVATRLA
jgi:predicted nucleic acid-binding protein